MMIKINLYLQKFYNSMLISQMTKVINLTKYFNKYNLILKKKSKNLNLNFNKNV